MEEIKVKAIVLSSADYKDKDKIVNLYSLELGLISVIVKNCKKSSYKLKFAYSPFSFAEFELFKSNEIFILKTATLIDNFFSLSEDYNKFIVGSNILELLLKTNRQFESNHLLFINALKTFNNLANEDVNEKLLLLKFMLGTLKVNGFRINFKTCNSCLKEFTHKIFLNLENGEFVCRECKSEYAVSVESDVFIMLRTINSTEVDNIKELSGGDKTINNAIKLIALNLEERFNIKLNSKRFF